MSKNPWSRAGNNPQAPTNPRVVFYSNAPHLPDQRRARRKDGKQFSSFNPAISKPALKKINAEVRSWRLHHRTGREFITVAREINPAVRGWMNYYGAFYRSAMYPVLQRINAYLIRWIRKKYKRLRAKRKAFQCWRGIVQRYPRMFAHWEWTASAPSVW